jgi:hypothetical protein
MMAFALFIAAALLVLSGSSGVEAVCRVRFELTPETSVLSYTGTSKLQQQGSSSFPLSSPVSEDKTVSKGVQGAIFLTSNDTKATCPNTTSGWLAALPNYTLTSSIPFFDSPLSIWPYMLPGQLKSALCRALFSAKVCLLHCLVAYATCGDLCPVYVQAKQLDSSTMPAT